MHIILSVLVASSASAGEHRNEVHMVMKGMNMGYDAAVLKVTKGTTVTFTNLDVMSPLIVTSGDGPGDPNKGAISIAKHCYIVNLLIKYLTYLECTNIIV